MNRSTVVAVCAVAVLALAGCGGGGTEDRAEAEPSTQPAPLPAVRPAEMRPLVGWWIGEAKDYFYFKADGSGMWVRDKHRLWTGAVIPEGGGRFRFSWDGGDPQTASYWGVTLNEDGKSLVFAGTNQTYKKRIVRKSSR